MAGRVKSNQSRTVCRPALIVFVGRIFNPSRRHPLIGPDYSYPFTSRDRKGAVCEDLTAP